MKGFHKPTVVTVVVIVLVMFAIYHVALGRRKGAEK